eukprot:1974930-Amphidinium_carterae.1
MLWNDLTPGMFSVCTEKPAAVQSGIRQRGYPDPSPASRDELKSSHGLLQARLGGELLRPGYNGPHCGFKLGQDNL